MGLRLIRENSDTPNVTNADDARMVRYAYGGYNGFVQGKGRELACEGNGDTLTINSGVIVLQGWEVEIDSNGWSMQVSRTDATKRYFTVYCEVNLSMGGTVSIKSTMDTINYPKVAEGDDLTKITNGVARLELCHFTAQSGVISEVDKIINVVPYSINLLSEVNKRLDEMGFKEASVENGAISLQDGWADAKASEVTVIKMAKFAILKKLYLGTKSKLDAGSIGTISGVSSTTLWGYVSSISGILAIIPEGFRPKVDLSIEGTAIVTASVFVREVPVTIMISKNGEITAKKTDYYVRDASLLSASYNNPAYITCKDIGWELA